MWYVGTTLARATSNQDTARRRHLRHARAEAASPDPAGLPHRGTRNSGPTTQLAGVSSTRCDPRGPTSGAAALAACPIRKRTQDSRVAGDAAECAFAPPARLG